jgi:hypothetical protein
MKSSMSSGSADVQAKKGEWCTFRDLYFLPVLATGRPSSEGGGFKPPHLLSYQREWGIPSDTSRRYRLNSRYNAFRRYFGMKMTRYLHPHFVWFKLSLSSIVDLRFVCLGGSHLGVSGTDFRICQTSTATAAESGGIL